MAGDSGTLVAAAAAAPETTRSGSIILDLAETFPVVETGDDGLPITTDPTQVAGWTPHPELEFMRASVGTGGDATGTLEFQRRFGRVKQPYQDDYDTVTPVHWRNWWVRARLIDENGAQTVIFVGKVLAERRTIGGEDVRKPGETTKIRTSVQSFVAYGARRLLRMTHVHQSIWQATKDNNPVEFFNYERRVADWTPDVNRLNEDGTLVGNRSFGPTRPQSANTNAEDPGDTSHATDTFLFSGKSDRALWNRLQFCNYLLDRFMNRLGDGSEDGSGYAPPVWRMAGRTDLLAKLSDHVPLGGGGNVDDLLQKLIDPQMGVDFYIEAVHDGFNVVVHSLLAEDVTFGQTTLVKNPRVFPLGPIKQYTAVEVVDSREFSVGRIRLLGGRLVMCCSLLARKWYASQSDADATLVGRWPKALEDEYKKAVSADDGLVNDAFRRQERFHSVYRDYGAPDDWDFTGSAGVKKGELTPVVSSEGLQGEAADQQPWVRRTLNWTPLRAGFDYQQSPPVNTNAPNVETDFLAPQAWLWEPNLEDLSQGRMVAASALDSIGVHPLQNDWGVRLQCTPNHLVAIGPFDTGDVRQTAVVPKYDAGWLVATIAFETDQRLKLEHVIDAADPTVMVIEDPNAELWALADKTMIGVDADGAVVTAKAQVLRDDTPKLALRMAGAIARYKNSRHRARVVAPGFKPWGGQLGAMLKGVDPGGDLPDFAACITAIEWEGGETPRTTLTAGYMR